MVISNSRILNLDIAITFQNIVVNNKNRGGGGDVLEASLTSCTIIALFLGCNGPGPYFLHFRVSYYSPSDRTHQWLPESKVRMNFQYELTILVNV